MGHVLFRRLVHGSLRPGRLKIAAILPIAILWFVFAGAASASNCTSGCTAGPTNQTTIDQTVNPSTTWTGPIFPVAGVSQPQDCAPMTQGVVCDTYELTTHDTGPVRVVVTWPGPMCANAAPGVCTDAAANDFDLLICLNDPLADAMEPIPDFCTGGTEIAHHFSNAIGFEEVDFTATANTTYEVRVLPDSITPPGTDYQGCAEYTNGSFTPNVCAAPPVVTPPPVTSSAFFTCPTDTGADRQVQGAGKLPASLDPTQDAHFSLNVQRKTRNGVKKLKGKVMYSEDHLINFRSKNVACAAFVDGTNSSSNNTTVFRGSVEIRGFGTLRQGDGSDPNGDKKGQVVCYRAVATDNGQPGKGRDQFEIEIFAYDPTTDTCAGTTTVANNAVITDGNIVYVYHCTDQEYGKDDND
jgi:hypothetical protein